MKKINRLIFLLIAVAFSLGACKGLKLEDIDEKFSEGKYFEAAEDYRKFYRKTSPKKRELRGEVAFKVGETYRLANNPVRANVGYANAIRYKVEDSTLHLQYARTLHKVGEYKKASEQYEAFLKLFPNNSFALNGLEGVKLAQEWKKNPTRHEIQRMTLFDGNKGGQMAPALLPKEYEQVFFASNAGKEIIGDTISPITGLRNNDIFMSRKDENGKWMKPEHLESAINTAGDEGVMSFSSSGTTMYYSYAPMDSVRSIPASIYVSTRSGGSWGQSQRLEIVKRDSTHVFAHPAIDESDKFLYFVSDMAGGYGGKDIWRASILGDLIEYVENLGPEINTAGDEMFPYMRNDSTLYFSSDGHPGMGGMDIYKADYETQTSKWIVSNMQSPINSHADDFGITFAGEKEEGFFSSNRNDGRGYDHIYSFTKPTITTKAEGYIVDTDDEFILNSTIRVVGKDGTNKKFPGKNNGTYELDVDAGIKYVLLASAPDHLNTRMQLTTEAIGRDSTYLIDFILTPINKPVVLENIFFDFDKSTLRPESKEGLDELIDLLNLNPNVSIELSSHTDRKGTDEYNNKLSQRRADAVMHYLIQIGGINAERLTSVGKGKSTPKNVTRGIVKKYDFLEEGQILTPEFIEELEPDHQAIADQINRRTEFKVSSITYGLE